MIGFDPKIADEICDVISDDPRMVEQICKEHPHWPSAKTIRSWRRKIPEFGREYTIAKQHQIEPLVEQILQLCDDKRYDFYEDEEGKIHINYAHLQRIRLKIDSIKWLAGKLVPRLYGDSRAEGSVDSNDFLNQLLKLAKEKRDAE